MLNAKVMNNQYTFIGNENSNGITVDLVMAAYPFTLRMTAFEYRHDMLPALDCHQLSGLDSRRSVLR